MRQLKALTRDHTRGNFSPTDFSTYEIATDGYSTICIPNENHRNEVDVDDRP